MHRYTSQKTPLASLECAHASLLARLMERNHRNIERMSTTKMRSMARDAQKAAAHTPATRIASLMMIPMNDR